ncbi:hypothetical protein OE88DRAFT_617055 [Heliocybe sulcata]|uniref:Uncharacterized protein n=1 Tax=Heliocybe sulcata TaxID=5364 RepID=A0A5C3NH85_9AGAM|nr:hypothetical protein OE88DRAFT_617055 [Heliocybe sulcata]
MILHRFCSRRRWVSDHPHLPTFTIRIPILPILRRPLLVPDLPNRLCHPLPKRRPLTSWIIDRRWPPPLLREPMISFRQWSTAMGHRRSACSSYAALPKLPTDGPCLLTYFWFSNPTIRARRTSISEGLPPSSSSTFSSVSRRSSHSRASAPTPRLASPDPGRRRRSSSRSRSMTPRRHYSPPPLPRPMTPPIEELSSASTNSTDSQPDVSRTLQTLRKILDDQPRPPEPPPSTVAAPRRASFMPKSPPPAPASGTSTATASVSRLFTKGTHHSSTRPPSPPRHSSLKQRSEPPTPVTASPSLLGIPGSPFSDGARSVASSGRSTPKRISFAELPESYGGSKPGGPEAAKYPGKRGRRKKKEGSESEGGAGWWTGWLLGANGTYGGTGMSMSVEGAGEGAGRGWGGKARFGGPMDEWGI